MIVDLHADLARLEAELDDLSTMLPKKCAYRLHAVMMHQGQVDRGHYWTYICDEDPSEANKKSESNSTSSLAAATHALSSLKHKFLSKLTSELSPQMQSHSTPLNFKINHFLKFNDAEVSQVPADQVFRDPRRGGMDDICAFCLVYVQVDSDYVQSRCRSQHARSHYMDFRPTGHPHDSLYLNPSSEWSVAE